MKPNFGLISASAVLLAIAAAGPATGADNAQSRSAATLFATGGSFAIQPVQVSTKRMTVARMASTSASGVARDLATNDFSNQPTLTLAGAKRVAAAAIAYARSHGAPGGSIAVVDAGGHTLYLERLDGTFAAASNISIGKARTAVHFGKPTRGLEEAINKGRPALLPVAGVTWFTPLQGGVPIVVDGRVIGGIGVSGAMSQQQDEEVANAGAGVIQSSPATTRTENP